MHAKYPKTPHLPWSLGISEDDERIVDTSALEGQQVVVTEKLDGENTTIYADGVHARSLDSRHHASRSYVKSLQSKIARNIPDTLRVVGENCYAVHSIKYQKLDDWFVMFMAIDDSDNRAGVCLSWDSTKSWAETLGLAMPPLLYEGIWDEIKIKNCFSGKSKCGGDQEGYVVRLAADFDMSDFSTSIAKFVRKNHVQTDEHWMTKTIEVNGRR